MGMKVTKEHFEVIRHYFEENDFMFDKVWVWVPNHGWNAMNIDSNHKEVNG